ncbi:MAG TPA: NAD(P)H-dependent glycerol-3-phosphate dehydrogenase [Thermoanaerobaculia bacterium]|jgi:glycerol-3-phosphate dehydrogenase (NAD(P)+)|nr:NAD(P)H-dependent glycerol-3-phosphate dehydrogenase [Thermoanaerobaculia bacterium]
MKNVAVVGAGSFGTALAVHAARAGCAVTLWARRAEAAADLAREHRNRRYLPEAELPAAINTTTDLGDVVDRDVLLMAVPSHGYREVLRALLARWRAPGELRLVSATKGIEGESLARMSQVSAEEATNAGVPLRFAALSGPSFAAELAAGVPTAAVIASDDEPLAVVLQELLSTRELRLYTSHDVAGVELAGAAKNVIAIAAGVVSGLGFGHNTLAALITRGLHEITRLGLAYGGQQQTFSGLAGLGDLVLTCTGALSRNRQAGLALARGEALARLESETGQVAEGVRTSVAIAHLAERRHVEMPICEQMVAVIHGGKSPRRAAEDLMLRELKPEAAL